MLQLQLLTALFFLGACSSGPFAIKKRQSKPLIYQDTSLELTRKPNSPHAASPSGAWQWRSLFALGAPMQSMIEPLSLGGDEWVVVTLGGGIGRWNLTKGFPIWHVDVDPGVGSRPLISGSYVYFAGADSFFRKLNLSNGKEVWSRKLSAESFGGVVASGGALIVNTADDALWSVDEKTGSVLWTYKRPSTKTNVYWSLRGQPVPTLTKDGTKIYVGFSDGTFVALESSSGKTLWERRFDQVQRVSDVDFTALLSSDEQRIFMVHADGALYALNASNGSVSWTVPNSGAAAPFLDAQGEFLYQGTRTGEVRKLRAKDGSILWSSSLKNPGLISSIRMTPQNHLVFSGSHSGIYFMEAESGKVIFEKATGYGPIAPAAVLDNQVYWISPRNHLYKFRTTVESAKRKTSS